MTNNTYKLNYIILKETFMNTNKMGYEQIIEKHGLLNTTIRDKETTIMLLKDLFKLTRDYKILVKYKKLEIEVKKLLLESKDLLIKSINIINQPNSNFTYY